MPTSPEAAPTYEDWRETLDTCAWQTGSFGNVPIWSKLHVWNDSGTRMLCGNAVNWRIGNVGSTDSGDCRRCFAIAWKREQARD